MDELTTLRQFVQDKVDAMSLEEDYAGFYAAFDAYHEVLGHIDALLAARTPTGS